MTVEKSSEPKEASTESFEHIDEPIVTTSASEEAPLLSRKERAQNNTFRKQYAVVTAAKIFFLLSGLCSVYIWWSIYSTQLGLPLKDIPARLKPFQKCSINRLSEDTNLEFLSTAHPLPIQEFVSRRDRLARALDSEGFDAFLVEPGYTFSYYANVSQPQWEVSRM